MSSLMYYLLHLPPLGLMCLLIFCCLLMGSLSTYLFRRLARVRVLRAHNEVTGYIFASSAGFYGLLLAFVVFLVWDQFNDAQQNADVEASLAKGLYRDIKYYPYADKNDTLLLHLYMNYVNSVIKEDEILLEETGKYYKERAQLGNISLKDFNDSIRDVTSVAAFNEVFKKIEGMHDTAAYKNDRTSQMFRHLNELATYRSLRYMATDSGISIYLWVPLLLGGLIIMIFAMLLDIENRRLHVTMNGLLGAFVGMIFYIITILDYPFYGAMRIDIKKSYDRIVQWNRK